MTDKVFMNLCREAVANYFNSKKEKQDVYKMSPNDVYIVWCVKALQNNKALCSTNVVDGMYYEITYNGDKDELYIDAYKKWDNVCKQHVTSGLIGG